MTVCGFFEVGIWRCVSIMQYINNHFTNTVFYFEFSMIVRNCILFIVESR